MLEIRVCLVELLAAFAFAKSQQPNQNVVNYIQTCLIIR
jgi:hypothetical protein